MDSQLNQGNGETYNFKKLVTGLVLLVISTAIFLAKFNEFQPESSFGTLAGIFFCVALFTIGLMMVFSAITFKNKMILLVAPFVAGLGTLFVLNFFYLTGISKLVTSYPQLQQSKITAEAKLNNAQHVINKLQKQNLSLQAKLHFSKAKDDYFQGKNLSAVLNDLRATTKSLQKSGNKELLTKVNALIKDVEQLSENINRRFIEIEDEL